MTNELLPSTAQVLPLEQRGKKPGRISAVSGIAAIAVLAAIAVAVLVRADSETGDPLFVLPATNDEWQLTNGAVANPADDVPGTAERFIFRGQLYGVAEVNAFVDLRSLTFYSESPLTGDSWDEIESSEIGDAYQRVDDSITIARQDYDDDSWEVASSPDDLVHVYGALGNDVYELVVVAAFSPPEGPYAPATSFDMTSVDGSTFTVETSASNSPLFDAATFAERVEPVDVNGVSGWVVSDELVDGTETSVTWSPTGGRTITVRSTAPPAAVIEVARLLETVSEDEWAVVFPDTEVD